MDGKNVLIGAGVVGAGVGAYYLWKKSQPEITIPPGTYADEYTPPAVTQDYQDTAPAAAQKEKEQQLLYLKQKMASFAQQQRQKMVAASAAEKTAIREEYKAQIADLKSKMLELQRERAAIGQDTKLDTEKDSQEIARQSVVYKRDEKTTALKTLPKAALVAEVAKLEKITDVNSRRVEAQRFRQSLSGYTEVSKQAAMRYANTWFASQPFETKKRVWDVMASIGLAQSLQAAWKAALKKQQEKEQASVDAAKTVLKERMSTQAAAKQTQANIAARKKQEEAQRISKEKAQQFAVKTEYEKSRMSVTQAAAKEVGQPTRITGASMADEAKEGEVLQALIAVTSKFPSMSPAQQKLAVQGVKVRVSSLPKAGQVRVRKAFLLWFARRPKAFQDKVRGLVKAAA